ncbi:MAG TPA: hypothetical protein VLT17_07715 [Gemmatimonadales bacterium]|nr:hypothetical protein [Gemmatimonadales bacterium]
MARLNGFKQPSDSDSPTAVRWFEDSATQAFVYFKHDDDTAGPELAAEFVKEVG